MSLQEYRDYISSRATAVHMPGFKPVSINTAAKHHQRQVIDFALSRAKSAAFLDTGLGKSFIELEFAKQCADETGKPSLILTPLAVAGQMIREGQKFNIDARQIRDQSEVGLGVMVANYERLAKLDPSCFGAVILDESSILKSYQSKTRVALTEAFKDTPYKLAATATPSPNDHTELGNHAEFLDVMRQQEMLSKWFINDTATASQEWRLKGHAAADFWGFVASWARCATLPSDLGGDDTGYVLPAIDRRIHTVAADRQQNVAQGMLFRIPEMSATSFHEEKRLTLRQRCDLSISIVMESFWCKLAEIVSGEIECRGSQNMPSSESKNTHLIQSMPQKCEHQHQVETPPQKETVALNQHTELPKLTMTECLLIRDILVQFVMQSTGRSEVKSFTSITATQPEKSDSFFARHVIPLLEKCRMMLEDCGAQSSILNAIKSESWLIFCETNEEQDILEAALGGLAFSVRGSDDPDEKERRILAWVDGQRPLLISKKKIVGFGMNFQHCRNLLETSVSFSYEALYQGLRRVWRFGQERQVNVHVVLSDTESSIWGVINAKSAKHDEMKRAMAAAMKSAQTVGVTRVVYDRPLDLEFPHWIKSEVKA